MAHSFGVGYIADSAIRAGTRCQVARGGAIDFIRWRKLASNRSMQIVNRIWYTFIGLLLVSVFLAMFGADLAKGFFLLWPSIFASAIVGVIVGRRGAIAAGLAGAFFLGPLVWPLPSARDGYTPTTWGNQLIEGFSTIGSCLLVGTIFSLALWTIFMLVFPPRLEAGSHSIVDSSIEVHPVTGVVTKRHLDADGLEGSTVSCE